MIATLLPCVLLPQGGATIRAGFPFSTLRDSLGGLWEREILIKGNAVFLNRANGNRIVVPLR